jgi:hypothetical protein
MIRLETGTNANGDAEVWIVPSDPNFHFLAQPYNKAPEVNGSSEIGPSPFITDRIYCSGILPKVVQEIISDKTDSVGLQQLFETDGSGQYYAHNSNSFDTYSKEVADNPKTASGETTIIRHVANFRLEATHTAQLAA